MEDDLADDEDLAKQAIVCVGQFPRMDSDLLNDALISAEHWPRRLGNLSLRATEADPANFVSSLQMLNAELCKHGFFIQRGDDRLTGAAARVGNRTEIERRKYRSATAAAYEIANRLLTALCEVMTDESIPDGFDPQSVGLPENWAACRTAVGRFFDGELSRIETFSNLGDAIAKERVELFPVNAGGGGQNAFQGNQATTLAKRQKGKRKRKASADRPLTEKQMEAAQIVGECGGDIAEAARRIGRDRKTVEQHYKAAMHKLGKQIQKPRTKRMPSDKRGQSTLTTDSDQR